MARRIARTRGHFYLWLGVFLSTVAQITFDGYPIPFWGTLDPIPTALVLLAFGLMAYGWRRIPEDPDEEPGVWLGTPGRAVAASTDAGIERDRFVDPMPVDAGDRSEPDRDGLAGVDAEAQATDRDDGADPRSREREQVLERDR